MAYASVVSGEIARIDLLVATLNGIPIIAVEFQNVYLNVKTKEKGFFYGGNEFKYDQGKVVVIMRAL